MNLNELKRIKFNVRLGENSYFNSIVKTNDVIEVNIKTFSKFACPNFYWKYDLSKSIFLCAKKINTNRRYANIFFFECDKLRVTKIPIDISKLIDLGVCTQTEFEIMFNWFMKK